MGGHIFLGNLQDQGKYPCGEIFSGGGGGGRFPVTPGIQVSGATLMAITLSINLDRDDKKNLDLKKIFLYIFSPILFPPFTLRLFKVAVDYIYHYSKNPVINEFNECSSQFLFL